MADPLLMDWDDRLDWHRTAGGLTATEILRGSEDTQLVAVLATAASRPQKADLRALLNERSGGGIPPVLIVATYPGPNGPLVAVLGLDDVSTPVYDLEPRLVEQLLLDALESNSPSGLKSEVNRRLGSMAGSIGPGFGNEGLFASHVLERQPEEPGWADLCAQAAPLVAKRGEALFDGLGYKLETVPDGTVLREATGGRSRRAAAVLLAAGESFDNPLSRLENKDAVTHGLALARRENLDWLIVLGGAVMRLYATDPDIGVGRKGQTQTYAELDLSLLTSDRTGYLALLFAPASIADGGAVARLLSDSARYAAALSERLRDRIYGEVVPALARAVADRRNVVAAPPTERRAALDDAYHQTLILLFRLMFVAYAEDRKLLPLDVSPQYTRNALKTHARDFVDNPGRRFSASSTAIWSDLTQVWGVIDTGDVEGWGVPAYNGGLFTKDPNKNRLGAESYDLQLTDSQVGPALRSLLIDLTEDSVLGPVDFRSLSVREFGTIYEGLLESGLGIADVDLTWDDKGNFVTAGPGDEVKVSSGQPYFHSRSGSRKATGSYFTKPFAVEHLLDNSLEPALTAHLRRVQELVDSHSSRAAADALFDFRVTDLSMGSGHFLVAAVDRVEARFSTFLAENRLPEVEADLHDLRTTAAGQLGVAPSEAGIDDSILLRRQIARRCIYGIDINEVAVELARLAIWIHTFVPGLPLSFLNHGLVCGNSLTGIGAISEINAAVVEIEARELKKKNEFQTTSLDAAIKEFLERADEHLAALGLLTDASVDEVSEAGSIQRKLEDALAPLSALCDLITAERATRHLGSVSDSETVFDRYGDSKTRKVRVPHPDRILLSANAGVFTANDAAELEQALLAHPHLARASAIARSLAATHMPVQFPEVFRRGRPGFDCIVGNPPWDKVRHEPQQFWVTVSPGLNALKDDQREAAIEDLRLSHPTEAERERVEIVWRSAQQELFKTAFAWRGGTHVELAQLVLERALRVTRTGGFLGLVLPRQVTVLAGWSGLRERLTQNYDLQIVQGRNQGEWIFDGIHESYAVVLLSAVASTEPETLLGVATSADDIKHWSPEACIRLSAADVSNLSPSWVLPWFGSPAERVVFDAMVDAPKLSGVDGWIRGWHDARWDFRGTGPDRTLITRTDAAGGWRVLMTAHVDAFAFDAAEPFKQYVTDHLRLVAKDRGVELDPDGAVRLGKTHPLIAVRHPSRSDDSRTLIATALPEQGILHNKGYVHAVATDEDVADIEKLALLGYINTVVADWWARRFVDRHITAPVINQLALPNWNRAQIDEAADITGTLLARNGARRLAGGIAVDNTVAGSETELLTRLNRLAFDGFGLRTEAVEIVFGDFSVKGIPPALRAALRQDSTSAAVVGSDGGAA